MYYKTIIIDGHSKVKRLAALVEAKANEMAREGGELSAFSMASTSKAVLVFRMPEHTGDAADAPAAETAGAAE